MKAIILFLTIIAGVYAANPHVYAALGDGIYNNANKIAKLKNVKSYAAFAPKVDTYIKKVKETKELGFAVESGEKKDQAKTYLKRLRTLAKQNDFFVRSANSLFESSLKKGDYKSVMELLDTGIIDTKRNRNKIVSFWEEHKGQFEPKGEFKRVIQESELRKNTKSSAEYYRKLKKLREQEKIRRLREKDKRRQEQLQKKLEEELKRKKRQIEEEQKKELGEK